jgi:hypothetical protein
VPEMLGRYLKQWNGTQNIGTILEMLEQYLKLLEQYLKLLEQFLRM